MSEDHILFNGTILPERADVNIATFPSINIDNIKILNISCLKSKLVIECLGEQGNNILSLKNVIESVVRVIVDALGYTLACGYDVEITSAFNITNKNYTVFGIHENIFDEQTINEMTMSGKPHPEAPSVGEILKLCFDDQQLSIALSDFREAIKQPDFTIFHCYRALESLKYGAPNEIKESAKQWNWLLGKLNMREETKGYLLKMGAGEQRHGRVRSTTWDQRKYALQITWQAILRYMYFKTSPEKLNQLPKL